MKKSLRPIRYPPGSEARRRYISFLMRHLRLNYREALREVAAANRRDRNTPGWNEKCGAKTRRGTSCRCKALPSGRCKYHGGLSTGPRTAEGRKRVAINLTRRR
jgi:hypothetical protein